MRAYRRISTELHALIEETRSCLFLWDSHGICPRPVQPRRKRHKGKHNAPNEEVCSVHRGDDHIRLASIVLRANAVVALPHALLDVADARHRASDRQTRSPPRDATSNVRWAV
jgi:hypothetical protein